MAANYLKSIYHHHHHSLRRHHSIDCPPTITTATRSFFLKPITSKTTNNPLISNSIFSTFALSSTSSSPSTTPSTSQAVTFDLLQQHLSSQNFRQADEETRRLLILLAGEGAQQRGYVFFSEVRFISEADLKTIDELWRKYSNKKFGYSVQKKVWNKEDRNITKFFLKVGWMKKLDTEVEQYNYRSFPEEFMWENNDQTPEGHLPLTNALRGTQLLNSLLSHPAFEGNDDEENQSGIVEEEGTRMSSNGKLPLSKRVLKTDYSF